ncbi:DMT family transporter [Pelagicoccus sp. SDUM812003]|uniref:DMT family transporter n=1 Tax=Pelagicoccus sp. SDUM812003 TaxID=3041267 RepID=UPI00280E5E54|nr:DMT family transporter [Pelagicoccus sp. SDUM812003]MDQ8205466.1 DMT family transporter [Pelagicoccus sp. SDUM812003]
MNQALANPKSRGAALVLLAGVCWGFHGVLIKFAYAMGASFMEVFLSEGIVASVVFAFLLRRSKSVQLPQSAKEWAWLALAGVTSLGVGSFLFLSFSLGPVAIGATLLFLYLPQIYLFSILSSRHAFRWSQLASVIILLLGAAIATDALSVFQGLESKGALLAGFAASVCYATIFLITPRISQHSSATFRSLFLSLANVLGSLLVLSSLPITRGEISSEPISFVALALVLGFVGQAIPIIAMMKGIPLAGSSLSGVLASTELPIAVISSALILDEAITLQRGAGVVLVFLGIVLFNLRSSK